MVECVIDVWGNGNQEWYKNGLLHHKDGPAVEWADGHKEWWINGKQHRDDGPAIENSNGYKEWYLNNKEYTQDEFVLLQFSKGVIK
jgi:hypothetical protein